MLNDRTDIGGSESAAGSAKLIRRARLDRIAAGSIWVAFFASAAALFAVA